MTRTRLPSALRVPIVLVALCLSSAPGTSQVGSEYRSIDGRGNNVDNPAWGSAGSVLNRMLSSSYGDGVGAPAGPDRPNAREISNLVFDQRESYRNPQGYSDLFWQWGQFLDHDIDLTGAMTPRESLDIPVPAGDVFFDPLGTGTVTIRFDRSAYRMVDGRREQLNEITAWIDASNVYGSDAVRALELRTLDGTGRLKTSPGDLLPFNVNGLPNAPTDDDPAFFLAGDVRANEQVGLTAMHTLFVREHNWWARLLGGGSRSGDEIYEEARRIVAAEIQAITYEEFLPALLGPRALDRYRGYRPDVKPDMANAFSTAAFRFGHSMLSPTLLRLDSRGRPIAEGDLPLADAFFNPGEIVEHGIEPLLRGLAGQVAQDVDTRIVDGVRNFLFGPPGAGGFDLAALNIQRGRDHGLPSYNDARRDLGLPPARSFADVTSDTDLEARLLSLYGDVEDLDLWVGGLAEDHDGDALVGQTFRVILKRQFEALRDGDRFWYERDMHQAVANRISRTTLTDIIRRNTDVGFEVQADAFLVPDRQR